MANYQQLKAAIDQVIKANGQKEITGPVLNDTLKAMVNSLGAGYQFRGVATPSTNPGTPDQNVLYIAGQAGTYTNFNSIVLPDGVSVLKWNGSWSSETVLVGDGVFDISAYKATGGTLATFADLSAALDDGNNIPSALRKGGMSVKFVQSSDNNYVQYRLVSQSFSATTIYWQKEESIELRFNAQTEILANSFLTNKYISAIGEILDSLDSYIVDKIPVVSGDSILWNFGGNTHISDYCIVAFDINDNRIDFWRDNNNRPTTPIIMPQESAYIIATMSIDNKESGWIKKNGYVVWSYPYRFSITNAEKITKLKEWVDDLDSIQNCYVDQYWSDYSNRTNAQGYIAGYKIDCEINVGDSVEWGFAYGTNPSNNVRLNFYDSNGNNIDYWGSGGGSNGKRSIDSFTYVGVKKVAVSGLYSDNFRPYLSVNGIKVFVAQKTSGEIAKNIEELKVKQNCYVNQYWSGYDNLALADNYIAGYIIDCPINIGDSVEWGIADGVNPEINVRLNFYDSNGVPVDWWGIGAAVDGVRYTDSFAYPGVKKVSVSGLYSANFKPYLEVNGIKVFEAQKTSGIETKEKCLRHLRIAQWNMGNLNYGLTGPLPDAELETALPLLKECFTNMRADLLFINECVPYINQGDDGETRKPLYETLLKQFYPHYITSLTEWMGCFSKIRFAMNDIAAPAGGSRPHKFGVVKIDGIDVAIAFVHCSPYNVAERVAELTAIASEFDGYDYGIIVGDTNITNNADTQEQIAQQMQPLLDAGFVFGNMGYWGLIPTLSFNPATPTVGPTMSTDNIIVKGFNIDYFEAFVEKDGSGNYQSYYSDHYPIRAEISSIMNT